MDAPAIGAAAAGIVTAIGAFLLGRRRESGTVNTTHADALWTRINQRLDTVESQARDLSAQVIELRTELARKEAIVASQAETIARHEERIAELYRERDEYREQIAALNLRGLELENRLQRAGREFTESEADHIQQEG